MEVLGSVFTAVAEKTSKGVLQVNPPSVDLLNIMSLGADAPLGLAIQAR